MFQCVHCSEDVYFRFSGALFRHCKICSGRVKSGALFRSENSLIARSRFVRDH